MKMLLGLSTRNLYLHLNLKKVTAYNVRFLSKSVEVPKNLLEDKISAHKQTDNGAVYDKKPFKLKIEAGKKYAWCLCGKSKNQPFCDGTHRDVFLKIKQKPIKFEVAESKEYWLCMCKHTKNRPFCDGTHKSKVVQDATSTIRQ